MDLRRRGVEMVRPYRARRLSELHRPKTKNHGSQRSLLEFRMGFPRSRTSKSTRSVGFQEDVSRSRNQLGG